MEKPPFVLRITDRPFAEEFAQEAAWGRPLMGLVVDSRRSPVTGYATGFLGIGEDRIDYIVRASPSSKVTAYEKRISLSDFVGVDIGVAEWCSAVAPRWQENLAKLLRQGGRFPPGLWREARTALAQLRPQSERAFYAHTAKSAGAGRRIGNDTELEGPAFEREAIATALELWSGQRKRRQVLLAAEPIREAAPFLRNLGTTTVREGTAIEGDASYIPGFDIVARHQVGAIEFAEPNGRTRLTVMNVNLKKLEQVLGVDLIYYNHVYRSFVLVQYKSMRGTIGEQCCYRPDQDKNFLPECRRIDKCLREFDALAQPSSIAHVDTRLGACPFFFKFCSLARVQALESNLSPGFYLPYHLMRRVLKSDESLGPQGGRVITWQTAGRYLSNTRMLDLIRSGWVGSSGNVTAKLEKTIEATLASGHSLIYAVTSPSSGGDVVHRDILGRYATPDEPDAYLEWQ